MRCIVFSYWRASVRLFSFQNSYRQERLKIAHNASILIQSIFRGSQVRKMSTPLRFMRHESAIIIQTKYRSVSNRLLYEQKKFAALYLQNWWRFLTSTSRMFHLCASIIQTAFRGYFKQKAYQELRVATIVVQRKRRFLVLEKKTRTEKAKATQVQAWYRMISQRKKFSRLRCTTVMMKYLSAIHSMKEEMATKIQAQFRGCLCRKSFLISKKSLIMIQSQYRMFSCSSKYYIFCYAVIILQSLYRGKIKRKRFQALQRSTLMLQKHYRGNHQRNEYQLLQNCAQRIQSWWRGQVICTAYRWYRSSIKIQSWWRSITAQNNFILHRGAAIAIQLGVRRYRYQCMIMDFQQQFAATSIQAIFRGSKCADIYHELRAAAITIERTYRGLVTRREISRHHAAASFIRQNWLKYVDRRQRSKSAHVIQIAFRKFFVMRQEQLRHFYVTRLQAWYRMSVNKRDFVLIQQSTRIIQVSLRGYMVRQAYLELRGATVTAQRFIRNLLQQQYRSNAAALLQRSWRHHIIKKQKLNICAKQLQCVFRGARLRKMIRSQSFAATLIQSWYRMKIARIKYLIQDICVVIMQSMFRGFRTRKIMCKSHRAANKIQSIFRQHLSERIVSKRRSAVIALQATWRCYRGCSKYRTKLISAILIQRWQRWWVFKNECAMCIQSWWRTMLAQKQNKELQGEKRKKRFDLSKLPYNVSSTKLCLTLSLSYQ